MAGVRQTTDKNGKPHKRWRFWYLNWQGKRTWGTGSTNKATTLRIARKLQEEHLQMRLGLRPKPGEAPATTPYAQAMQDYLSWGKREGGRTRRPWSPIHLATRRRHLGWWQEALSLENLSDLEGKLLQAEKALERLGSSERTPKTVATYAESIKAFTKWCVKRNLLPQDPLNELAITNTEPVVERRALEVRELQAILNAAPAKRRILYAVAVTTGLRAGELKQLRVVHLDSERRGLVLDATWTKNRKPGFQPLPSTLVDELAASTQGMPASTPLLSVPRHPARSLYIDLERAGVAKSTDAGKVDFHSLRTTFTTLVLEAGAHPKEAQSLLRHSTVELTMNRYAKTRDDRLHDITERVAHTIQVKTNCAIRVQHKKGLDTENRANPQSERTCACEKLVAGAGFEPATPCV